MEYFYRFKENNFWSQIKFNDLLDAIIFCQKDNKEGHIVNSDSYKIVFYPKAKL